MIPLTNKQIQSYEKQKVCHICKEKSFVMIKIMKKNLKARKKSEIIVIAPENLEELLIVNAI